MNAITLPQADEELELAFDHYQRQAHNLGLELVEEYRRGVDRILEYPRAWRALDDTFRRYRLHRFPYGIVYRISEADDLIVIVEFMHMHQQFRRRT
jgi:toxin ParE1/3/4